MVLTKVFAAITVAWVLCEGPNVVFKLVRVPIWEFSDCNDGLFFYCNNSVCYEWEYWLTLAEAVTKMLKNLFPLLNTVMQLVLLRPLQQPLLEVFGSLRCSKKKAGINVRDHNPRLASKQE